MDNILSTHRPSDRAYGKEENIPDQLFDVLSRSSATG
jgi:hypothetical protein